jgi:hypothetical protein
MSKRWRIEQRSPQMQRAWITGLTLAGVVGTGGAAFAGMSLTHTDGNAVEAQAPAASAATTAPTTSTTYRLGDAGLVTLDSAGGVITVTSVLPSAGWTVVTSSNPGLHVEVSLTDGVEVLQMTADLVDGRIVAALNSSATTTTAAPTPAAAPAPASASPVVVLVPTPHAPVAATTATSGSTHVTTPSGASRHHSAGHEANEHEGGSDD